MNENVYSEILIDHLKPCGDLLYPEGFILHQENASTHISAENREWLDRLRITWVKFSAKSPDFNPIEDLWHIW